VGVGPQIDERVALWWPNHQFRGPTERGLSALAWSAWSGSDTRDGNRKPAPGQPSRPALTVGRLSEYAAASTRKEAPVRTRSLLLALCLLGVGATVVGQPPPAVPFTPPSPPSDAAQYVPPGAPPVSRARQQVPPPPIAERIPPAGVPNVPAPPAEKSVEQLLKDLEGVQAQKVDILKREADLKTAVQQKLEAIQKQADKLGAGPAVPKAREPNRVGSVRVEGFSKKDEPKVVAMLKILPGQILQYPELEVTRARLEKAGFKGAEVLALPNDLDSAFNDILIRSGSPVER
jgi:hypothetical protein